MRLEDVKGNYLKKNMHWLWTDVLNFSCSWYLSKLRLCLRWLHVMWNIINYNSLFPCHFNHLLRFHLRLQAISWRWESSVGKKAGGNCNSFPVNKNCNCLPLLRRKKTRKRKGAQKADQSKEENLEMARLAALLQISHFQQVLCDITGSRCL